MDKKTESLILDAAYLRLRKNSLTEINDRLDGLDGRMDGLGGRSTCFSMQRLLRPDQEAPATGDPLRGPNQLPLAVSMCQESLWQSAGSSPAPVR